MNRALKRVLPTTVGVLVISGAVFGAHAALSDPDARRTKASKPQPLQAVAMFFRVGSVDELKALTEVSIVAEVAAVSDGPTLVLDADKKNVAARSSALPSKDVKLKVIETLRGAIEELPTWSVPLAPGGLEVENDPLPQVGERYVLFLRPHHVFEGRWVTPTMDGRLRLDEMGVPRPLLPDGVGAELAAARVDGIREMVK